MPYVRVDIHDAELSRLRSENEALKDQLRWRTGTDSPKDGGEYLGKTSTINDIWRYDGLNGEWLQLDPDDQTFQPVYRPPDFWLPIPPLPEEAP